jgi:hypothetical protein
MMRSADYDKENTVVNKFNQAYKKPLGGDNLMVSKHELDVVMIDHVAHTFSLTQIETNSRANTRQESFRYFTQGCDQPSP